MFNLQHLQDLQQEISRVLATGPGGEIGKNAKAALSGVLARMDLVTREEFDIQTQVLARTREKLEALTARLEALEKTKADTKSNPTTADTPASASSSTTPPAA